MIAFEGCSVQWRVLLCVHYVTSSASHEEEITNLLVTAFRGEVQ